MNTVGSLVTAYYKAINGNVPGFNVYALGVPEEETGNYVWIYPEGGNDDNTKSSKNENIIIRVEVFTMFQNVADQSICEVADELIKNIIVPTPGTIGLTVPAGLQFLGVMRENYVYNIEQLQPGVVYRKTSRYIQRVTQTT